MRGGWITKKLYSKRMCNKKVIMMGRILNVLGMMAIAAADPDLNAGCSLLLYEPQKPEKLKKVSKKDLLL